MGNTQTTSSNPLLFSNPNNSNSNNSSSSSNMILQLISSPIINNNTSEIDKLKYLYTEINKPNITPLNLQNKLTKRFDYLSSRHRLLNIAPPDTTNGISVLERTNNGIISMGFTFNEETNLDDILHTLFIILYGDSNNKKPIKEEKLNEFPKKLYSDIDDKHKLHNECQICQLEYEPDSEVIILPKCNHYFHTDCIKKWLLEYDNTCPLCREKYSEDEEE